MRRFTVSFLTLCLGCLSLADAGAAQQPPATQAMRTNGTIRSVDCDAQQLTLAGGGGTGVLQSTLATEIVVNGGASSLCALRGYVGAAAVVWVIPQGGQLILARLEVNEVPATPTAPWNPPATARAPQWIPPSGDGAPSWTPPASAGPAPPAVPSIAGAVLGTILVGGLVYLLVRAANGTMYRYPYYGGYLPYYYQPQYHPYTGTVRGAPVYTYGPYRRCPNGTWSQWCR